MTSNNHVFRKDHASNEQRHAYVLVIDRALACLKPMLTIKKGVVRVLP
jgi:hypothetical protein